MNFINAIYEYTQKWFPPCQDFWFGHLYFFDIHGVKPFFLIYEKLYSQGIAIVKFLQLSDSDILYTNSIIIY